MNRNLFKRFLRGTSGNFAMIAGICMLPIGIVVGVATDYSRASNALAQMQALADSAALAAASSKKTNANDLRQVAEDYIRANADGLVQNVQISPASQFDASNATITVALQNDVPTTFMRLAGVKKVDINAKAEAERYGIVKQAEISLVLDITNSMNATVPDGRTRIQALKDIATDFVNKTMVSDKVFVSVVPYSDYVKVGTPAELRQMNLPWAEIPEDYNVVVPDKTWTRYEKQVCTDPPSDKKCYAKVDGKDIQIACPQECKTVTLDPPVVETTPGWTDEFRFWGCFFSRYDNNVRLTQDKYGIEKFKAYLWTVPQCEVKLLPLTNQKSSVLYKINELKTAPLEGKFSSAGERVDWKWFGIDTYIPTGLTWGWNTLSSKNYFPNNKPNPEITKKVMVLMSDGANTAVFEDPRFNTPGVNPPEFIGRHRTLWDWEIKYKPERIAIFADELERTKNDMVTLCQNIKQDGIEIYTISFGDADPDANARLKACATTPDHHYFLAMNAIELQNAFGVINESMAGKVRLVN